MGMAMKLKAIVHASSTPPSRVSATPPHRRAEAFEPIAQAAGGAMAITGERAADLQLAVHR